MLPDRLIRGYFRSARTSGNNIEWASAGAGMLLACVIGFVLGWLGSMPMAGPIGLLIIGRGLAGRYRGGLLLGVGSAIPESGYACLAFWGYSELLARYAWIELAGQVVSVGILLGLGAILLVRRPEEEASEEEGGARRGEHTSFLLGLGISLMNPSLIANWASASMIVRSAGILDFHAGLALPFAAGVGLGISGWYVVVVRLLERHRTRFEPHTRQRLMRAIGGLLIVFGSLLGLRVVGIW